jgi:uncharacterized protein YndB with AHSA1/START domain
MSKKLKPSSTKKLKKKSAKVSKKLSKPVKAASKKVAPKKSSGKSKTSKPVKQKSVKAIAKPVKKVTVKKTLKKTTKIPAKKIVSKSKISNKKTTAASKVTKTPAAKSIKKPESKPIVATAKKIKESPRNNKAQTSIIKNPVHLKKDNSPIPEFKPIIQPTVKTDNGAQKESFATALKNSTATSILTSPAKKAEAYSIKPEKEPAGKFEMEFVIRASAELLYEFLITPSGLSEWFCDDVNIRNGIYTFIWDGQLQQARLLKTIEEQLVRYQWVDKTDGSYFEFKIQRDELTNDISLIITDFAGDKGEQDSAKLLWASQIDKLLHVMGSFF